MKKILILAAILTIFPLITFTQNASDSREKSSNNFGVYFTSGISTQIHSYPNIMNYYNAQFTSEKDYGRHAEQFLLIPGIGFNYFFTVKEWFVIKPQIGYIQKGCSITEEINKNLASNLLIYEGESVTYKNRFHYISGDILLQFKINKWKLKPYLQIGIRNDFLINYKIEYDIDNIKPYCMIPGIDELSDMPYPDESDYKNFNTFNYGIVNGIGLEFAKRWFIEIETNLDIGYLVKNSDLKVKNSVNRISLGIKI